MQRAVQFEANIEGGVIRVPEQYIRAVPSAVQVTLVPSGEPRVRVGRRAGAGDLSSADFSALRIDTRDWRFDREEANERG